MKETSREHRQLGGGGGQRPAGRLLACVIGCLALTVAAPAAAAGQAPPEIAVKRLPRAPTLLDFVEMRAPADLEPHLARVDRFVQRNPADGAPATRLTEAYLGYDADHLYVIFLCFDGDSGVRAHLTPRERIAADDVVSIHLDTSNRRRRAVSFMSNPLGIQADAVWTDDAGSDFDFDLVFSSRGRRTSRGYVVWFAIPFTSLRFEDAPDHEWGILLGRDIRRRGEEAYWPRYSMRTRSRLAQMGVLRGLRDISRGASRQFLPYVAAGVRSAGPAPARAVTRHRRIGFDYKQLFSDTLVLDAAVNPDFSQVEADEPQVTVNQRFEVIYPEKRPLFTENAEFLSPPGTPILPVVTRRLRDPQFGVRLSGTAGRYGVGVLAADDASAGVEAEEGDRRVAGLFRVTRTIGAHSQGGVLFTTLHDGSTRHRLAGVDMHARLGATWSITGKALRSATSSSFQLRRGVATDVLLSHAGRHVTYGVWLADITPGFSLPLGYVQRNDFRTAAQSFAYCFRPEGSRVQCWGPLLQLQVAFDHAGHRTDLISGVGGRLDFSSQAHIQFLRYDAVERLGPRDTPALRAPENFGSGRNDLAVTIEPSSWLRWETTTSWGTRANLQPAQGLAPYRGAHRYHRSRVLFRPWAKVELDAAYLFTSLGAPDRRDPAFQNHLLRTRANLQLAPRLALRLVAQYSRLTRDAAWSGLPASRALGSDVLLSYVVNPVTAVHAGWASASEGWPAEAPEAGLMPHGVRQWFVKMTRPIRF